MSACWACRTRRAAGALALAALAVMAAWPAPAGARTRVHVRTPGDSVTADVTVSEHGVRVGKRVTGGVSVDVDTKDDSAAQGGVGVVVDDSGSGVVRLFSDVHVPPGQKVEGDVVAVFGSVRVEGEVTGSVVAVFGSVEVAPGASAGEDAVAIGGRAQVDGQVTGSTVAVLGGVRVGHAATVGGDAVSVGGGLDAATGSRVAGQSVAIGFLPLTLGLPGTLAVLAMVALGWALSLFFGWLFGLLFPARLASVAATASRRTFLSLVIGVLSVFAVPIMSVLLMVTVIGIPIGLLLPLVHVAVGYAGQLAATYVLGCKIVRRRIDERGTFAPLAAGTLFLALFFVVAAFLWNQPGFVRTVSVFLFAAGTALVAGLTAIGTGAFVLSRFGGHAPGLATQGPGPEPARPGEPGPAPAA